MLCAWCGVGNVCVGMMSVIVGGGFGGYVGTLWLGLEIV